jgi:hypothetical protein
VTGNLYLAEDFVAGISGYELLTPEPKPIAPRGEPVRGDDDFSHFVYTSRVSQTPDFVSAPTFNKLYDAHGGALDLVSRDPADNPLSTDSEIARGGPYPVSSNGDRIYFQNPALAQCNPPVCELYMREGNTVTYRVSASECTVACGSTEREDVFRGATPSGDKAFFVSCAKLTDASAPDSGSCSPAGGAAGAKLYRWDLNAPAGHHLLDISADHEPADGAQPNVRGFIGASEDGNMVYFAASGQIVPGQAAVGGAGIYRWRFNDGSPIVNYLGSVESGDSQDWNEESNRRVTPDGKYVMVSTAARLDPVADSDSSIDVYRWDEENGWICISCQRPGVPSVGPASENTGAFTTTHLINPFGGISTPNPVITMSNDGRVFFQTPDALVPADVNGEAGCPVVEFSGKERPVQSCDDVYEWHDGTVSLISGGAGSEPSILVASSASGNDVFFLTRNRLVGWDVDDGVDLYDARVGGGFPEPPAEPAECEGEACRGEGSSGGSIPGAGSAVFEGPGNQEKSLDCKPGFVRRNGKCVRKRHRRKHAHHRATNRNRRIER